MNEMIFFFFFWGNNTLRDFAETYAKYHFTHIDVPMITELHFVLKFNYPDALLRGNL